MNDDELRRAYSALREHRRAARDDAAAEPRPSPEALWSAVAGDLEPDERMRVLDETLRAGGSDDVALAYTMHSAVTDVGDARLGQSDTTRGRRAGRRWWPLAAAAALLATVSVPLWRQPGRDDAATFGDARYRDGGSSALVLVAPVNASALTDPAQFTWRTVPNAREYLLEMLDAEGGTVTRVITADSAATLPSTLSSADRQRIAGWWVTATTRDGAVVRSELRLVRPPQRP